MTQKTILQYYGVGAVERLMTSSKEFVKGEMPCLDPERIIGIELEIEGGIANTLQWWPTDVMMLTEDGSLRNGGREFITVPMETQYAEKLLAKFFKKNAIKQETHYSDRTSVHIHVNAQNLTIDQVRAVALVYQTVERLLFTYVGEERENNIYCVPWYQAGFTTYAMDKLLNNHGQVTRNWVKYTALNFQPLREKGTMEFRHLRGTCNVEEIVIWINLITAIVKYGESHGYDAVSKLIMAMNTVSNYEAFVRDVFGEYYYVLTKAPNYQMLLSEGVVDSKLMLIKEPAVPKKEWQHPASYASRETLEEHRVAAESLGYSFNMEVAEAILENTRRARARRAENTAPRASTASTIFPDWQAAALRTDMQLDDITVAEARLRETTRPIDWDALVRGETEIVSVNVEE